jgi:hypothetical protein
MKWNLPVRIVAALGSCLKKWIDGKMQAISRVWAIGLPWQGRCGCLVGA